MAARTEPATEFPVPQLFDLRQLRASDLAPLLAEETDAWAAALDWDFTRSAELVERFVDLRALNGAALVQNGEVVGYSYYVFEEQKGLIGDLYVRQAARTFEAELRLMESVLDGLMRARVDRIEAQLMMAETLGEPLSAISPMISACERNFMMLDMDDARIPPRPGRAYIDRWSEEYHDAAAQLIAAAYAGHIDSRINDQYRSVAGARKFLFNIVHYPGCGSFFRPASYAAFDTTTGRLCGICLASLVSTECGHITQVCVTPRAKGTGVGYDLLRHSLAAMKALGCRKTSLTVTACNYDAVRLYERIGFRTIRKFFAYVWER